MAIFHSYVNLPEGSDGESPAFEGDSSSKYRYVVSSSQAVSNDHKVIPTNVGIAMP